MTTRAIATAISLAVLACQPAPTVDAPGSGEPARAVAQIDGVEVSQAELDDWIKEELFAQKTSGGSPAKLYDLRADALGRLVAKRALESAAEKANLDEEQVLENAAAELGPVSDEEVTTFFEENSAQMGDATLEKITPQIRAFLEQRRRAEARAAITAGAEVVVHLEAPRFEIAASGPGRGAEDARVTIIEFSDFQCPYCQRADQVVKQVLERYPNDVRVVYRHLPLENIHSRARPAAEASACAADQDQFWAYHDKLFANQRQLEDPDLKRFAEELGLDSARFDACVAERTHRDQVDVDAAAAQGAGVTGTPAFFVNGRLLSGSRPAEEFYKIIDAELGREVEGDAAPTESSG